MVITVLLQLIWMHKKLLTQSIFNHFFFKLCMKIHETLCITWYSKVRKRLQTCAMTGRCATFRSVVETNRTVCGKLRSKTNFGIFAISRASPWPLTFEGQQEAVVIHPFIIKTHNWGSSNYKIHTGQMAKCAALHKMGTPVCLVALGLPLPPAYL